MRANSGHAAVPVEQRCLQALQDIGEAVTEATDRRGLLDLVVTRVVGALGADAGSIRLLDSTGEWLERAAACNVDQPLLLHGARIRVGVSVAGQAMASGAPVVVDLAQDARLAYHQELRRRGFATLVVAPLVIRGALTGTLDLYFGPGEGLGPAELGLAQGFARAAAVALDSQRLHEENAQRARETETLLSVAGIMSSTLDLTEVARRAVREMVRLSGADIGGAWVQVDSPHEFAPVAGYHVPVEVRDRLQGMPLLVIHPLVGEVIDRKRSICSSHSQMDPLFDHPLLRLLPHKSVMAIPMRKDDDVIGVFVIVWTGEYHRFSVSEQRLLEGVARAGAAAIDNARLVEAERSGWKAVEVSEAKYRALVENVSDIVYSYGFDGRLITANAAAASVTGYRVDELEGMSLAQLVAPEYLPAIEQSVAKIAAGHGDALSITLEIVCKDGRRRVLECHSRATVKDGVPTAVQGTAHDVTERARLERRQAALTEITKDVAAEHDVDGLLGLIGRHACELIGAAAAAVFVVEDEHIVLRSGHGLRIPARSPRWRAADSRLGATVRSRTSRVTEDLTRDDEWDASLLLAADYRGIVEVPIIHGGEVTGVLCALTVSAHAFSADDVALLESLAAHAAIALDRAKLVNQLKVRLREAETLLVVTERLYQQVDAKHVELTDTTHALEEALAARSEFLAKVSHEIRTPLANVLGLLGMVIDGLAANATEQEAFVAEAHANARHLLGLVNGILDMSCIEAGKLDVHLEPLDLVETLDAVRALVGHQAEAKGLEFAVHLPPPPAPPVMADPTRLHQVFLNVIGNSVKFTQRGRIDVRVMPAADRGVVVIEVTDTGIGVPLEFQSRLFEKFVQVDGGGRRTYGGSGLGLAVSRHLVEMMGGSITLQSEGDGLGTTVTVTMPLLSAAQRVEA